MAPFIRRHRLALFIGLVAVVEAGAFVARLGKEATPFALVQRISTEIEGGVVMTPATAPHQRTAQ